MPKSPIHSLCSLGLLAVLVLAGACGAPAAPAEPTAAPTTVPPTAAPVATQAPVATPSEPPAQQGLTPATEACAALEPVLFKALGVEIETAEVPFEDPFSGKSGTACALTAKDTGRFFQSVDVTMGAVDLVLTSHGYTEDTKYVADGPTGTARGYRQGNLLCIAHVNWEPSPDANCPKDQPISACELTPEQQLYTVSITAVNDASADAQLAPGGITPATAACTDLEPAIFKALGAEVKIAEAPFKDPLSDQPGTCCEMTANGTGATFQSLDVTMEALKLVFTSHGWTEDTHYVADGPTGTARGFRKDDALCVVWVKWEAAPDSGCPPDKLISECDLRPEQILYTVKIQGVLGL